MGNLSLLWLGAVPAVLVGQIYVLGRQMSEPERMIRPLPGGGVTPQQHDTISRYSEWLASQNLQFRTAFQFGKIQTVFYQQGSYPRFFAFFFHQSRITFSAESYLEDSTVLDTGNSGSPRLFPRPGAYAQSFPNMPAQQLWLKHLEGETYLTQRFGHRCLPTNRSYEEIFAEAVRIRMKHNRSQFLWPVRVLYRYFVTGQTTTGRTIAQQYP